MLPLLYLSLNNLYRCKRLKRNDRKKNANFFIVCVLSQGYKRQKIMKLLPLIFCVRLPKVFHFFSVSLSYFKTRRCFGKEYKNCKPTDVSVCQHRPTLKNTRLIMRNGFVLIRSEVFISSHVLSYSRLRSKLLRCETMPLIGFSIVLLAVNHQDLILDDQVLFHSEIPRRSDRGNLPLGWVFLLVRRQPQSFANPVSLLSFLNEINLYSHALSFSRTFESRQQPIPPPPHTCRTNSLLSATDSSQALPRH